MLIRATPHGHFMGWRRDAPDRRDFVFGASTHLLRMGLAPELSLRFSLFTPPVYNQFEIGSCTGNAAARVVQFVRRHSGEAPDFVPSRLQLYYDARAREGTIASDAGAELRDVMKNVASLGVCPETEWPYDIDAADPVTGLFPAGSPCVTRPPQRVYVEALKHVAIQYFRLVQNAQQMKGCIAEGFPFMFGFTVYDSIYDANSNPVVDLPMPSPGARIIGGHAVVCVGYDDARRMPDAAPGAFLIANSWGPDVQDAGYFWFPYAYMTDPNLATDFWTIRRIAA